MLVAKEMLDSTSNADLVPGVDSLKLELPGIEIVVRSLVDCVCFLDTVESLVSLISSSEALFCTVFRGKTVSVVASLEELVFSLGSDVSEMLEISI